MPLGSKHFCSLYHGRYVEDPPLTKGELPKALTFSDAFEKDGDVSFIIQKLCKYWLLFSHILLSPHTGNKKGKLFFWQDQWLHSEHGLIAIERV